MVEDLSSSRPTDGRPTVSPGIRGAAVVFGANAVGFGVGGIVTLWHLQRTAELPMTPFGFRAFSGPFERLGLAPFTALLWAFVGVCALEALAGAWLWRGRRRGAALGLATTPPALALAAGFALPIFLAGIPVRLALLVAGRRSLH